MKDREGKGIEVNSYMRPIDDLTQVYRITAVNDETVVAHKKNEPATTFKPSEIIIGGDEGMIEFEGDISLHSL